MTLYLLLLIKSFKLVIRFINIQQDTLFFTDLMHIEQISKNFRSCFKVRESEIHYRATSKTPRLLIHSSVPDKIQPKYLNRAFSHDVTAAMLVFQRNETAAMLVYQTNPVGVQLFSYVNTSFCSNKFACELVT